jgi:hypothetical protein
VFRTIGDQPSLWESLLPEEVLRLRFRSYVEPTEPTKGLEVPPEVVEALGAGKRPAVTITINGHSWKSRVAIIRGGYLLGLSNANRFAVTSRAVPPFGAGIGPVPIRTKTVQVWTFCALMNRRTQGLVICCRGGAAAQAAGCAARA